MNPFGYHLTNNLIHAANTAVFYLIALRLLGKASRLTGGTLRAAGVMAALFFALHPLRAESVAWVTERRDVLSGLFFLLTVLLYLAAADADGAPRRRLLVASVTGYALALLSKSIVMTLPLILLVLDVYPLGRLPLRRGMWREAAIRALLREKLPYLALGFAGAVVSYWAVASQHFLTGSDRYGWPARIGMAGYSVWFYVEKTAVPLALSPLYELPRVVSLLEARFLWSIVAAVAISLVLLALRRRWPVGLAVWVYYGIAIGPVAGIVHVRPPAHERPVQLPVLPGPGADRGSGRRADGIRGRRRARCARGSHGSPPWRRRPGFSPSGPSRGIKYKYGGTPRPCGATRWNPIRRARSARTMSASSYYGRQLYAPAKAKYELALALRPDRLRVHGNLGLVLHEHG